MDKARKAKLRQLINRYERGDSGVLTERALLSALVAANDAVMFKDLVYAFRIDEHASPEDRFELMIFDPEIL